MPQLVNFYISKTEKLQPSINKPEFGDYRVVVENDNIIYTIRTGTPILNQSEVISFSMGADGQILDIKKVYTTLPKKIQHAVKFIKTFMDEVNKANLTNDIATKAQIFLENCELVGIFNMCEQSGGKSNTNNFLKTYKTYMGIDGVKRVVYSKNGKNYVKKRDPKTGKFVYRQVKP